MAAMLGLLTITLMGLGLWLQRGQIDEFRTPFGAADRNDGHGLIRN